MQQSQFWKISGVLAFLPHLLAVVISSALRPDFDHYRQYLSELGERDSTTQFYMNYLGIIPTGALITLFGFFLCRSYARDRLALIAGGLIMISGLARMTVGFFPCDLSCVPATPSLSQEIHNISAKIVFVSLTAAAFTMGAFLIKKRHRPHMIVMSYLAGTITSITIFILMHNPGNVIGMYQRIALATLHFWLTYFALYLIFSEKNRGLNYEELIHS